MNAARRTLYCALVLATLGAMPAANAQSSPPDEEQLRKRAEEILRQSRFQRGTQGRATAGVEQALHQYLLAEIAGQRGETPAAIDSMIALARRSGDARIARRALELAFQSRQQGRAMEAASLWMSLEPESSLARQAMAVLLVNQGSLEVAKTSLKPLLQDPVRAPALYLQLNQLLARFQDKSAVTEAVKELVAIQPDLPQAQFSLAVALASNNENVGALVAARRALEKDVTFQSAAVMVGQLLREGSPAAAREHFEKHLSVQPDAYEVRHAYARLLVSLQSLDAAAAEYRKLEARRPEDPEMPFALGLVAQQAGDFAAAEAAFKRTLDLNVRDRNPIWMSLGQVEEARKNWDAALDWFGKVDGDEYLVPSRLRMANIIVRQKDLAAARAFLRDSSVEAGDHGVQFVLAEAQLLRDARDFKEAEAVLSRGLQGHPDSPDLLYDRAMVLEKLNDVAGLERDLRKVISLKPDHAHAYNALGYTLADRNARLDEALTLIEKAVVLAPRDGFILDSLGWVHFRLGNLERAVAVLRQAFTLRNDPEIAAHLSEVLWAAGQRDEAGRLLDQSQARHPGNEALDALRRRLKP
jgi:tetratricopeptide (TPR) repeat protein